MNEKDQFLKDVEPKPNEGLDQFETPLNEEDKTEEKKDEAKEEDEVPDELKNRRHKRLEAHNQRLREENIQLNTRLQTISETKKFTSETADAQDDLKSIERIYGTDSPEALAATELLKSTLANVQKRATEDALNIIRKEQREASEAVRKEEQALDSMLEDLEDEYNVDLTSPKAEELRKGFFKRLEKLSPKDADGNILHYADPHAVWEDFHSKIQKKPDTRAKDLSARSMNQTTGADSQVKTNSNEQWLRDNNII